MALIGPALGSDIVIHRIDWEADGRSAARRARLALTIHIAPAVGDIGAAIAVSEAFAARVALRFPGLDVRVFDPPIDILPDQYLSGEVNLDDATDDAAETGYEAVISIVLPAGWPLEPSS